MTFDVPLATCASSLERTTSVRLASSPIAFLRNRMSLGWPSEQVRDRLVYKGPLPLRCSCSYVHTPFIGLSEDDTFRTSPAVGLVLISGIPVFTMVCWKGVSLPSRLWIRLISLLWALLLSSRLHLLRVLRLCALSMRRGRLAHFLARYWRTLLPLVTLLLSSTGLLVFCPFAPL